MFILLLILTWGMLFSGAVLWFQDQKLQVALITFAISVPLAALQAIFSQPSRYKAGFKRGLRGKTKSLTHFLFDSGENKAAYQEGYRDGQMDRLGATAPARNLPVHRPTPGNAD